MPKSWQRWFPTINKCGCTLSLPSPKIFYRAIELQKHSNYNTVLADIQHLGPALPAVKTVAFSVVLSTILPEEVKEEKKRRKEGQEKGKEEKKQTTTPKPTRNWP